MKDRLIETFANTLNVPATSLNNETSPANTPEWDSLATINLSLAIELEFGIRLSTQEIMSMKSIALARSVLQKKGVLT